MSETPEELGRSVLAALDDLLGRFLYNTQTRDRGRREITDLCRRIEQQRQEIATTEWYLDEEVRDGAKILRDRVVSGRGSARWRENSAGPPRAR